MGEVRDIFDQPVLADLAAKLRCGSTLYRAIPRLEHHGPTELSFAQGRLFFLDQLSAATTWYIMPIAVRLRGPLQLHALNVALSALVERQEVLRTTFGQRDGEAVQVVRPHCHRELRVIDVVSVADGDCHSILEREQTTPFDLATEPGWRTALLRVGADDHVLSIVMHHIASDGWSIDIIRRDLATFYSAALRRLDPLSQVSPLPIQYRDYALWQRQEPQGEEYGRQLEYWVQQLEDSQPAELLCDHVRPAALSGKAGVVELTIEGTMYHKLDRFCKAHQTTPFVVLLAAFRSTHYRLTGAEDGTIGTPVANRGRQELEDLVGFFVNTQCMRITVGEDETFRALVQQVRSTATAAIANQDVPFERIVSTLLPGTRGASRNPLVQLMFAVHSQLDLGTIPGGRCPGQAARISPRPR